MSSERPETHSDKRARRSTRIGIVALILIAIIMAAVVWGIYRWVDEDETGPSVLAPSSPIVAIAA